MGNLDAAALPGGVVSDYVYDDLNRLELLVQHGPGEVDGAPSDSDVANNEILASYDYLLRADGRRLGVVELADGGTPGTNTDLTSEADTPDPATLPSDRATPLHIPHPTIRFSLW